MKYLLDVNAVIASLFVPHEHHNRVMTWAAGKLLAVCPLSELGYLRIVTGRSYGVSMSDAREALKAFCERHRVELLADDISALDSKPEASSQVTDMYLAELAERHGMKLATFDGGIKHPAVVGI